MEKYILCAVENGRERQVMTCSDFDSTAKQGLELKCDFVIYEANKIVEHKEKR